MTQMETVWTEKSSLFDMVPADFVEMAKKRAAEFADAQSELFGKLQEASQQWLDRMQVEAKLANEFASKLGAAGSIPNAMTTCQEWTSQWTKMMSEDQEHLLADYRKFAETSVRLFMLKAH
jgi:hypothetical protein